MATKATSSVTVFDVSDGVNLGTNILRNTNSMTVLNNTAPAYYWENAGWRSASSGTMTRTIIDITDCPDANIKKGFKISGLRTNTNTSHVSQDKIPLKVGETYTMSCYARGTNISNGAKINFQWYKDSSNSKSKSISVTENWEKYQFTFSPTAENGNVYFGVPSFSVNEESNSVEFCGMKLELGSVASPWTESEIEDSYNVSVSMTTCVNGVLHIEISKNGSVSSEPLYAEVQYRYGDSSDWQISSSSSGNITGLKDINYNGNILGMSYRVDIYKDSGKTNLLCSGSCSASADGADGQRGNLEYSGTDIYGIRDEDYAWPVTGITPIEGDTYINSLTGDKYIYTSEDKWHWIGRTISDNDDGNALRFFSPSTPYDRKPSSSKDYISSVMEDGENPFGQIDTLAHYHVNNGTDATEAMPYYTTVKVNNAHTYRYSCYVKLLDKNSTQHFGIRAYTESGDAYVNALNGDTTQNGYVANSSTLEAGKWYLVVGYIVGKDISVQPEDNGVYEVDTKQKVLACTGKRWKNTTKQFVMNGTRILYKGSAFTADSDVYIYDLRLDDMTETRLSVKDLLEIDTGNSLRYFGERTWSTVQILDHKVGDDVNFNNNLHVTVNKGDTVYFDIINSDTGRKGKLYAVANASWSEGSVDWGAISCSIKSYNWESAPNMPNLISDIGFGLRGWGTPGATILKQDFEETINKHFISFQKTAGNDSYSTSYRVYYSNTGLFENETYYTVSFWAKAAATGQSLRITRGNVDNTEVSLTDTWAFYTVHISSTSNTAAISFMPYKELNAVYLAGVTMEKGDVYTQKEDLRSPGLYQLLSSPENYTTAIYGQTPTNRISFSECADKLRIGDTVKYNNVQYTVCAISTSNYYLNSPVDLQGEDGNGIEGIDYFYAVTQNQTAPSASSVTSTTIPTLSSTNKYLWQKEVIKYTNNEEKVTVALIAVHGNKGDKGEAGTSVKIKGHKDSTSQLPTKGNEIGDGWIVNGDLYVWTEDGLWDNVGRIQGPQGDPATQYYIHYVYCDNPTVGENYSKNEGRRYVGIYTDETEEDAATFNDVPTNAVWSLMAENPNLVDGNTANTIDTVDATSWKSANGHVDFDRDENTWKMSTDNGTTGSSFTAGILTSYFENPQVGKDYTCTVKYKITKKSGTVGTIASGYDFRFYFRSGTASSTGSGDYKAINKESDIKYGEWVTWKGYFKLTETANKLRFMARIYRLGGYELWIKDIKIEEGNVSSDFSYSRNDKKGNQGEPGESGNGIADIQYFYKDTPTPNQPEESEITNPDIPSTFSATSRYLWQKEIISYTKEQTPKVTVSLLSVYGETGNPGNKTFVNDYGLINYTDTEWETRTASGYPTTTSDGYYQADISGLQKGDIVIIPCTLTERGNITGQIYARVTGISSGTTTVGGKKYYRLATTALYGVTGGKGETGNYTVNVQLYYVGGTSTPPNKPTSRVISTSTATKATWTQGKYTGFDLNKGYYTCTQIETWDPNNTEEPVSCEWSAVVRDTEYENAGRAKLTADGKYLGLKTSTPTGYSSASNFDWFLANYTSSATTTADAITEGNVYVWNGSKWVRETNSAHLNVCMGDMMSLVDTVTGTSTDVVKVATVFAQTLATKTAFIDKLTVNKMMSSNYDATEKTGYYMDGTIEYHYGKAIYDSDYIRIGDTTSLNMTCIGYLAGKYGGTTSRIAIGYEAMKGNSEKPMTGLGNIAIGNYSSDSLESGGRNTALGDSSLGGNKNGSYNVAIGHNAISMSDASSCIGIGYLSLSNYGDHSNVSNIALGKFALSINGVDARDNIAVGNYAMGDDNSEPSYDPEGNPIYIGVGGRRNIAMGTYALQKVKYGESNVAIGYDAGGILNISNQDSGKKGMYNVAVGSESLSAATTSNYNTVIGGKAGYNITTGNDIIAIGYNTETISKVMNNQMNIGGRLWYFEFSKAVHTNNDVYICLDKLLDAKSSNRQYVGCIGFYKDAPLNIIYRYSDTQIRLRGNDSDKYTINKGNTSKITDDMAFLLISNKIISNNIRPTDVSGYVSTVS